MKTNNRKKRVYWHRVLITKLIELYEQHECLYNENHKNYNNRIERLKAHRNMLRELQVIEPHLRLPNVRSRISAIRSQYANQLALMESMESAGKTFESKLWYFPKLSYLRDYIKAAPLDEKNSPQYDDDHDSNDGGESFYRELKRRRFRSKNRNWDLFVTEQFIQLLKEHPCLYDEQHPDYGDYEKRTVARKIILEEIKNVLPDATITDVIAKIKTLRDQYIREKNCKALAEKNNEKYVPRLGWFDQLSFMNVSKQRRITSKTKVEVPPEDMEDEYNNNNVDEPSDATTLELEDIVDNNSFDANVADMTTEDVDDAHDIESSLFRSETNTLFNEPVSNGCSEANVRLEVVENYDWLGRLLTSQVHEISPTLRSDFAWDVQCLIRKYILKSKNPGAELEKEEAGKTEMPFESRNIVLPRSSNMSLNISFI
ncbi:uncharacterized protein LOC101891398 [Musca domestica]|uniref:Uncharacterized protein LOC101891398 n=1 Tax=Musca domestica TaxID=7370 RepID=A0A9J7CPT7_MUSDO|nr:uncharacterized protein LOC101891398 [Musca domestica]